MTKIEIRKIIRNHADAQGCVYRITAGDEVHYYGKMPNSIETGWYFVGHGAETVAREISDGRR
jgi:hypothetical protein